jgi:hypothetical protein
MNARLMWAVGLTLGICVCAAVQAQSGEVKVAIEQTPPAVQKTIRNELVGARLEDIAKKRREGIQEGRSGKQRTDETASGTTKEAGWRETFEVSKSDLAPTGNNRWLTIQPGRVLELRHGIDSLTVTVLDQTMTVDGVDVGVLEERETKDGKLVEVSRNFFATDKNTADVYYFGEDVDNYKDGRVADHESAWRAGERGARFGLMIPGRPKKGDRFYQEIAPKVAMDRVEIVSTDETVKTPAGTFEHCVHLKETSALDGDVSHKWHAAGVGIVKDDEFELAHPPEHGPR